MSWWLTVYRQQKSLNSGQEWKQFDTTTGACQIMFLCSPLKHNHCRLTSMLFPGINQPWKVEEWFWNVRGCWRSSGCERLFRDGAQSQQHVRENNRQHLQHISKIYPVCCTCHQCTHFFHSKPETYTSLTKKKFLSYFFRTRWRFLTLKQCLMQHMRWWWCILFSQECRSLWDLSALDSRCKNYIIDFFAYATFYQLLEHGIVVVVVVWGQCSAS